MSYGKTEVLSNINLSIEEGEFVALIGFSGSGKTTLMSILAGLVQPDAAKCRCAASARRAGSGSRRGVPELLADALAHGVRELALAVDAVFAAEPRERRERTEKYVRMVGLGHATDRRPAELSGGMRQRVAVAARSR